MSTTTFVRARWSGSYEVYPQGGLVLTDLRHDEYNLAKAIRVMRIWLNPGQKNEVSLQLGTVDCDFDGKQQPSFPAIVCR